MGYFTDFQYVNYDFPDGVTRAFKNISLRTSFVEELQNSVTSFETYDIAEGETPESIAYDFYGDPNLHWIILLSNNILNVYTDWPKGTIHFDLWLRSKYGSITMSNGKVVELSDEDYQTYVEFVGSPSNEYQTTITLVSDSDSEIFNVRPMYFVDEDGTVYNYETVMDSDISLPEVTGVSIYNHWSDKNEQKRSIIIPKSSFVDQIKKEMKDLLNE